MSDLFSFYPLYITDFVSSAAFWVQLKSPRFKTKDFEIVEIMRQENLADKPDICIFSTVTNSL